MTEGNYLALIVGVLLFVFALCVSVALGLLVEAWLGFMTFAAFALACIAVVLVSYANAHPKEREE